MTDAVETAAWIVAGAALYLLIAILTGRILHGCGGHP